MTLYKNSNTLILKRLLSLTIYLQLILYIKLLKIEHKNKLFQ